jgi:hypothetical protein
MPVDLHELKTNARNYAEGTELAAALETRARIEQSQDKSRESWTRRWLDLSDWARRRELRDLERNLVQSLEELRRANENAQKRADEARHCSVWADGFFDGVVKASDSQREGEISRRWSESKTYREEALEALKVAADANNDYLEAKLVVALAQAQSQAARRYYSKLREIRPHATAKGFLFAIVFIVITALSLHYRFHSP